MEKYMTDKAKKGAWWEYPVIIVSGLLMIGFIQTGVNAFSTEHPAASIAASLTVVLLSALPLILVLLRRDRRSSARIFSECLANRREAFIPFDRADAVTGVKRAAMKLDDLRARGYMKGFSMDFDKKRIRLTGTDDD